MEPVMIPGDLNHCPHCGAELVRHAYAYVCPRCEYAEDDVEVAG